MHGQHDATHRNARAHGPDRTPPGAPFDPPSDDEGDNDRPHAQGNRDKAANYPLHVQIVLARACTIFRVRLATEHAFPDQDEAGEWARQAWFDACEYLQMDLAPTVELLKLILRRMAQLRGEVKTKARAITELIFELVSSNRPQVIANNRLRVERALDRNAFACKDPSNRKGLFQNRAILKVLCLCWFVNAKDEGPRFPALFRPIPKELIALILAAIRCVLDEWAAGVFKAIKFTALDYKAVYEQHLKELREFESACDAADSALLRTICGRLHDAAQYHSGADPLVTDAMSQLSENDFAAAIADGFQASDDEDLDEMEE